MWRCALPISVKVYCTILRLPKEYRVYVGIQLQQCPHHVLVPALRGSQQRSPSILVLTLAKVPVKDWT